jgi:hypothetical protein
MAELLEFVDCHESVFQLVTWSFPVRSPLFFSSYQLCHILCLRPLRVSLCFSVPRPKSLRHIDAGDLPNCPCISSEKEKEGEGREWSVADGRCGWPSMNKNARPVCGLGSTSPTAEFGGGFGADAVWEVGLLASGLRRDGSSF